MNDEGALRIVHDEIVAPGAPWSACVGRGQVLRIVDLEGAQGVDFLCYDAADPRERYYAPNTIKKSGTLRLTEGHALYSDRGRPLFTVVADTCGYHDTIAGCCSGPSNAMLYGVEGVPGCRENFLTALAEHGLGWTDIVPNVNFFCAVPVYEGGRLAERTFVGGASRPGDHVDLISTLYKITSRPCPEDLVFGDFVEGLFEREHDAPHVSDVLPGLAPGPVAHPHLVT